MSSSCKVAACVVALAVAWPMSSQAEEKPLWEAGLGVGGLVFPDYRGSDEVNAYPVPVPYFVYRGKFLKADRDGLRGELFDKRYLELSLSMNATIPVSSDDNDARQGMPDLRPTLEFGPSLDLHLWQSPKQAVKLDLVMPLRVPVTLDSSPKTLGWNFSPRLNLDIADVGGLQGWNFGVGAGPLFGAEQYHEYFYSVAPRYATAERPAYDARGGYSGTHVVAAISKHFPRYWVGAYLRYDNLHNAVFEDSPLVRRQNYVTGGFGIAWMIGESTRMVEVEE